MIIDSHQHVFWHGRDDAGLVADMDEHGIDVAWLLSWEIPPFEDAKMYHGVLNPAHLRADGTHAGIPLSDLLKARERYPDRFIVGYCPHPMTVSAVDLFRSAVGIHGVRVCGEWKFRIPFDDPRCLNLYRAAGELNCPVVLHLDVPYIPAGASSAARQRGTGSSDRGESRDKMPAVATPLYQPNWYGGTVENLERALVACPETIFIGHAPGFWREISGDADKADAAYPKTPVTPGGRLHGLFDKYPNLHADLSAGSALTALRRDIDHARTFLARYADRLLFGRDIYGQDLHEFLTSLNLPTDLRDAIYFKNATRLLPAES